MAAYIDSVTAKFSHILLEITSPLNGVNYIFEEQPSERDKTSQLIQNILNEIYARLRGYEIAVSRVH